MMLELVCPYCPFHFRASSHTPSTQIIDRMIEDGPWFALGDGATFKDMIFKALSTRGALRCPECHEHVAISEVDCLESAEAELACC
jgi:hypothetical protein